jgi:DNA-binding beta-propeller fold protein YncE
MTRRHTIYRRWPGIATLCVIATTAAGAVDVSVQPLWKLSDFNGPVLFNAGSIEIDPVHAEAIWLTGNRARVFNATGMEVFDFELPIPQVVDLAKVSGSDMVLLTVEAQGETRFGLTRIDFRGRVRSEIRIGAFPEAFAGFKPEQVEYRPGHLYLVNRTESRVVILDERGTFLEGIDLAQYVDNRENVRGKPELAGFAVAGDGTMAFTVPLVDGAFLLLPDRTSRRWGRGGSNPGSFGIVGGIAIDDLHRTYVVDTLRRVILCFDENQEFVREFTGRGANVGEGLAYPREIVVDPAGRLYVSQMGMQGAAVLAAEWE